MSTPPQEKGYFLELNEYFLLAARTSSLGGPPVIEDLREAPLDSKTAVSQLLNTVFPDTKKGTARAICALRPRLRFFHLAEDSETRQYSTPTALRAFVSHSQQAGTGASEIIALQTSSGMPLNASGKVDGRWIFEGSPRDSLAAMQATVHGWKLAPFRVESATLAMLGAIHAEQQVNKASPLLLVWEIGETTSDLFLISSEGLMAAKRLAFGFDKVADSVQTEMGLKAKETAAKVFFNEFYDFSENGAKITARISPSLLPEIVDLVPAEARASVMLLCTGLPSKQAWFNEHMARSLSLASWQPDVVGWCSRAGLSFIGNTLQVSLSPVWLGLLGVISAFQADKPDADIAWHPVWNCNGTIPATNDKPAAAAAPPPKPEPAPIPAVLETVKPPAAPTVLPAEKVVIVAVSPPPPAAPAPAPPPPAAITAAPDKPGAEDKPAPPSAASATPKPVPAPAAAVPKTNTIAAATSAPPPAVAAPLYSLSTATTTGPYRPAAGDRSSTPSVTSVTPIPVPARPATTEPPASTIVSTKVETVASAPTTTPTPAKARAPEATAKVDKPAEAEDSMVAPTPSVRETPEPIAAASVAPLFPKAAAATAETAEPIATPPSPPAAAPAEIPVAVVAAAAERPATATPILVTVSGERDLPPQASPAPEPTSVPSPAGRRRFLKTPAGIAVISSAVMVLGATIFFYRQFAEEKAAALHAQTVAEQHAAAETAARRQAEQQVKVEAGARRRAEEEVAQKNAAAEVARQQAAEEGRRREIETNRLLNGRGSLVIATEPAGATIDIGNLAPRVSPATVSDLRLGHYTVKISLTGYDPVNLEVEIKDNEATVPGPIHLVRQTGSLTLATEPAGENYEVRPAASRFFAAASDLRQGKTPATLTDLPTGEYTVIFSREGWPTHTENVVIEHNRAAQISSKFPGGSVTITSTPAGASVTRNGLALGGTPLTLEDVQPGEASYTLEVQGYIPVDVTGRVEPEKTLRLDATLISVDRIAGPSDLDERPVPIKTVEPIIDHDQEKTERTAIISLMIDRDGTPKDLKVEQASNAQFGRRCLEAAARWRFSPGKIKGIPVRTRVSLPFDFVPP